MKYTKRYIQKPLMEEVRRQSEHKNVILLKGARQVGKTTMLKNMFPIGETVFVDLYEQPAISRLIDQTENFADFCIVLERYAGFVPDGKKILIIDEAQLSQKLGHHVRSMKENWNNQAVILTGSTLSDLFNDVPSPVGRVVEFTLRPFNFLEFLDALSENTILNKIKTWTIISTHTDVIHDEILKLLFEYVSVGGLPAVVVQYAEDRGVKGELWRRELENIIAYYRRDVEGIKKSQLTTLFEQTMKRLAVTTGSITKDSTIVKSSSPGYRHVKDIFALLEEWKIVIRVDGVLSKLSKVGTIAPKRYLFDHGVRNFYTPSNMGFVDRNYLKTDLGTGVIEQFVLTELLSLNFTGNINYWMMTHQSGEVDFLLLHSGKQFGIEVKSAEVLNRNHLTSLISLKEIRPDVEPLLCNLSHGELVESRCGLIPIIPVYQLFSYFVENALEN